MVDVEEDVKGVNDGALTCRGTTEFEDLCLVDALIDPALALGCRCGTCRVAPTEPGPNGKVESVRVADLPYGLQDCGKIANHARDGVETLFGLIEDALCGIDVWGVEVPSGGRRGKTVLVCIVRIVCIVLVTVMGSVVKVGDRSQRFDAAKFNLGTASIKVGFVGQAGEEGEGTNVGTRKGERGIDDLVVPEHGVRKRQHGRDAEPFGDADEGDRERGGDEHRGRRRARMHVKMDEKREYMVGPSKESGFVFERGRVEYGML